MVSALKIKYTIHRSQSLRLYRVNICDIMEYSFLTQEWKLYAIAYINMFKKLNLEYAELCHLLLSRLITNHTLWTHFVEENWSYIEQPLH